MGFALQLGVLFVAYLLGSLCSAIYVCRIMGLPDPRTVGSRNPGTTNVKRIGGVGPAALTLLGDGLKGGIPVLVAQKLAFSPLWMSLILLAAVFGHIWSIFLQFQGGKGWATVLGGFLALSLPFGFSVIASWLLIVALFRISALGALGAVALSPLWAWFWMGEPIYIGLSSLLAVLLIYTHRENIQKLLQK